MGEDEQAKSTTVIKTYKNIKASITKDDSGKTSLRIPISSTTEDRDGDDFSPEGLKNMLEQLNTGNIGLYLDHGFSTFGIYNALDMIGAFYGGDIDQNELYGNVKLDMDDERAKTLYRKIEKGLPIGYSVAFVPIDSKEKPNHRRTYNKVDLLEVSAVGIPSNRGMINPMGRSPQLEAMVKSIMVQELDSMTKTVTKTTDDEEYTSAVNTLAEYYGCEPAEVLDALKALDDIPEDEDEKQPDSNNPEDEDQKETAEDEDEDEEKEAAGDEDDMKNIVALIDERVKLALEAGQKKAMTPPKKGKQHPPKTITLPKPEDTGSPEDEDKKSMGLRFNPGY